jgi:hypothetical protein
VSKTDLRGQVRKANEIRVGDIVRVVPVRCWQDGSVRYPPRDAMVHARPPSTKGVSRNREQAEQQWEQWWRGEHPDAIKGARPEWTDRLAVAVKRRLNKGTGAPTQYEDWHVRFVDDDSEGCVNFVSLRRINVLEAMAEAAK